MGAIRLGAVKGHILTHSHGSMPALWDLLRDKETKGDLTGKSVNMGLGSN